MLMKLFLSGSLTTTGVVALHSALRREPAIPHANAVPIRVVDASQLDSV
ncbi:hypothetical protein [Paraburkholderia oxyphila]|nr:hypothetical protein [Paraburkholderia oxyphila]